MESPHVDYLFNDALDLGMYTINPKNQSNLNPNPILIGGLWLK